jgi:two-component system phosphate regulon response regulator PhoB
MFAAHRIHPIETGSENMSLKGLICSGDAEFCLLITYLFILEGVEAEIAETVEEAVAYVNEGNVSAIILDCQPHSNFAPAICVQLKSEELASDIPIVAFVKPGENNGYLELLKAGVDQAFVRPIAPELQRSYLRSIVSDAAETKDEHREDGMVIFGKIKISTHTHRVQNADGKDIHLSPIEFRLLRQLLSVPGQVFSREELIRAAWPDNIFVELRTVDVHIGRLRRLLAQETGTNLIRTVRSAGYAIDVAA